MRGLFRLNLADMGRAGLGPAGELRAKLSSFRQSGGSSADKPPGGSGRRGQAEGPKKSGSAGRQPKPTSPRPQQGGEGSSVKGLKKGSPGKKSADRKGPRT